MMQKKICMLGGFAVGKTSLVRRFVSHVFSDHYHTTIGVTVEKKVVKAGDQDLTLVLWDLYGEDEFQHVRDSYLRGSSGYILVMDGTRRATLETAVSLQHTAARVLGDVPFVAIINKADLQSEWDIDATAIDELRQRGWTVIMGSAKLGEGVDELFMGLAGKILKTSSVTDTRL